MDINIITPLMNVPLKTQRAQYTLLLPIATPSKTKSNPRRRWSESERPGEQDIQRFIVGQMCRFKELKRRQMWMKFRKWSRAWYKTDGGKTRSWRTLQNALKILSYKKQEAIEGCQAKGWQGQIGVSKRWLQPTDQTGGEWGSCREIN